VYCLYLSIGHETGLSPSLVCLTEALLKSGKGLCPPFLDLTGGHVHMLRIVIGELVAGYQTFKASTSLTC
jgi:hypothetical protein